MTEYSYSLHLTAGRAADIRPDPCIGWEAKDLHRPAGRQGKGT